MVLLRQCVSALANSTPLNHPNSALCTKKTLLFLDGVYVSAEAVYLYLMSILWHSLQSDIFKGKKYENCSNVSLKTSWHRAKVQLNYIRLSMCQRFFSLYFYFR